MKREISFRIYTKKRGAMNQNIGGRWGEGNPTTQIGRTKEIIGKVLALGTM